MTVGTIFAAGGIAKLMPDNRHAFEHYLRGSGMFPARTIPVLLALVPGVELLVATMLFLPPLRGGAWILAGGLGASFAVLHTASTFLGEVPPCGCLGTSAVGRPATHHAVMAGMASLIICLAWFARRVDSLRPTQ